MQVRNGLSSRCSIVDTDVIGVRSVLIVNRPFRLIEQGQHPQSLGRIDLEERADMPLRNDQAVSFGYWKAVVNPYRMIIFGSDTPRMQFTKRAVHAFRIPRHDGYCEHPQKAFPALLPCFATRRTMELPHFGHDGASTGTAPASPPIP